MAEGSTPNDSNSSFYSYTSDDSFYPSNTENFCKPDGNEVSNPVNTATNGEEGVFYSDFKNDMREYCTSLKSLESYSSETSNIELHNTDRQDDSNEQSFSNHKRTNKPALKPKPSITHKPSQQSTEQNEESHRLSMNTPLNTSSSSVNSSQQNIDYNISGKDTADVVSKNVLYKKVSTATHVATNSSRTTTGKRGRPEITIVDAQPMNVVGFREIACNKPTELNQSHPLNKAPQRTPPAVASKPTITNQSHPTRNIEPQRPPVVASKPPSLNQLPGSNVSTELPPSYEESCTSIPLVPKLLKLCDSEDVKNKTASNRPTIIRPKKDILSQNTASSQIDKPKSKQPVLMPKPLVGIKPKSLSNNRNLQSESQTTINKPIKALPLSNTRVMVDSSISSRKPTIIRPAHRSSSVPYGLESIDNALNETKENEEKENTNKTNINHGSSERFQSLIDIPNTFNKPFNGVPPPLPSSSPVANSKRFSQSMMDFREVGLIQEEKLKPTGPIPVPRKSNNSRPQPRARPRSMINVLRPDQDSKKELTSDKKIPPGRPPPPKRPPLPNTNKLKRPASMMNLSTNFQVEENCSKVINKSPSIKTKGVPPPRPSRGPPPRPNEGPHLRNIGKQMLKSADVAIGSQECYQKKETSLVNTDNSPVASVDITSSNKQLDCELKDHQSSSQHTVDGPHAIAEHHYEATHDDEISFKPGDIIMLTKYVDEKWLEGRINGKLGMFPISFVKVLEHPKQSKTKSKSSVGEVVGPRCIARFDFEGEKDEDLRFKAGEVISLIEHVGTEWMRGSLNDKTGVFPVGFIEIIEPLPMQFPVPTLSWDDEPASSSIDITKKETGTVPFKVDTKPTDINSSNFHPLTTVEHVDEVFEKKECIALYEYNGDQPSDLSFKKGERIKIIEEIDKEWWKGEQNGKTGMFPSAFVEIIESLPEDCATKLSINSPENNSQNTPIQDVDKSTSIVLQTEYVQALFDYPGDADGDLAFKAGDIIELDSKISNEWYKGHIGDKEGLFPSNFVGPMEINTN